MREALVASRGTLNQVTTILKRQMSRRNLSSYETMALNSAKHTLQKIKDVLARDNWEGYDGSQKRTGHKHSS